MLDWLLLPVDLARAHELSPIVSWHGRVMMLAWGVLAPLAVLAARYFKIVPWQDWPNELDNQTWWRSHWVGLSLVLALTVVGAGLTISSDIPDHSHGLLGYLICLLVIAQVLLGVFRGSKGGPTAPARDGSWAGDHYDMTSWRLRFERWHKSAGYTVLALSVATVVTGLWQANAPRWMWLVLAAWWLLLCVAAINLQRRGWAVDTYQAVWGPGKQHPGNQLPSQGWGAQRPSLSDRDKQSMRSQKPATKNGEIGVR